MSLDSCPIPLDLEQKMKKYDISTLHTVSRIDDK